MDAGRYAIASTETAWRSEWVDQVTLSAIGPEHVLEHAFSAADVIY
jgi:hypothetical protein